MPLKICQKKLKLFDTWIENIRCVRRHQRSMILVMPWHWRHVLMPQIVSGPSFPQASIEARLITHFQPFIDGLSVISCACADLTAWSTTIYLSSYFLLLLYFRLCTLTYSRGFLSSAHLVHIICLMVPCK